ncbi:MAG TPA: hypothetical protein VM452_02510 [Caulifigura sp.]|nr:hypothetical protein [Caulifigura sp.]
MKIVIAVTAMAVVIRPLAARNQRERNGDATAAVEAVGLRHERAFPRPGVGAEPRHDGPAPAAMSNDSPAD